MKITPSEDILQSAEKLLYHNIKYKDALHIACAIRSKSRLFSDN
jgi:predicted nucleic acid-binding protein